MEDKDRILNYDSERKERTSHPLPKISQKTVTDYFMISSLIKMERDDPETYKKFNLGDGFLLREITPEIEAAIDPVHLAMLRAQTAERIEEVRQASGLTALGEEDIPINLDNSITLWQTSSNLWEAAVRQPVYRYFSSLKSAMASARIKANTAQRKGQIETKKAEDWKKTRIARLAVHDAIQLGCPEVIKIGEGENNTYTVAIAVDEVDRRNILSDTSHILARSFYNEPYNWERALKAQQAKLQQAKISQPLFMMEHPPYIKYE